MSTVLQFEDFAAPRAIPAQRFSPEDLLQHYQQGLTEGAASAREAAMDALSTQLQAALAAAGDEAQIRRRAIAETLAAIAPVLQAVTRQLASAPSDRLTDHLSAELERLCLAGVAPTCRIAGEAGLIEQLRRRIDAMGLSGVSLAAGPHTEITFDGGHITVDPDQISAQISAILAEIHTNMGD